MVAHGSCGGRSGDLVTGGGVNPLHSAAMTASDGGTSWAGGAGAAAAGNPVESSFAGVVWPPSAEEMEAAVSGYRIVALLGSGGMGAVYKATQLNLDRMVAIKVLPRGLGADVEFRRRFRREARAMAQLNHPNIVQIHDYGETAGGLLYIVMEMVDGSDLHRLVRAGQIDVEGSLIAVSQICHALQYAHERGFVHRDIKPANIFVNREGLVKVGDFGLAKLVEVPVAGLGFGKQSGLTVSGMVLGTPGYAAPEQLRGEGGIDHRADLYSLGVMFYEMLTREMPQGAPRAPSRRVADLDDRIDAIVFRAMDPDPCGRYQTAGEMRLDVDTVRTTPACEAVEESGDLPGEVRGAEVVSPPWLVRSHGSGGGGVPEHLELLKTTRSLNFTTLLLGMMALLTLGALAFFLAQRRTGDVTTVESSTTNTQVSNSYFQQLMANGVATAGDLEALADLGADGDRFIAVSRRALPFAAAEALAGRVGAEVLSVEPSDEGSRRLLAGWMGGALDPAGSPEVWVRANGIPYLFDGSELRVPAAASLERRVLMQWTRASGPVAAVMLPSPGVLYSEAAEPGDVSAGPGEELKALAEDPPAMAGKEDEVADPGAELPEIPEWTNLDGVTIQGEFVRLEGEAVVIRRGGRSYTIPFGRLSAGSVGQAKRLGGRKP